MENSASVHRTNGRPASTSFTSLFETYRSRLNATLQRQMEEARRAAADAGTPSLDLVDALTDLIRSGGKRLRPALVHFGCRACGGTDVDHLRSLEVAVELLHTYLLVHDDVMDHGDVRRGVPTAHVRFRDEHRRNGWRGDAVHYGTSQAILVGNLAHAQAHERFTEACQAAPDPAALRRAFATMEEEVIGGQHLEMRLAQQQDAAPEQLQRVLQLKSGRYSVERPLQLGALVAGASEGQIAALRRYGGAAGEAFQLRDDLLGMFGDPDAMGKPVGDDLREGKMTFLVHHTLQLAAPDDQKRVRQALGTASLTDEEVREVGGLMRRCGAVDRVRAMIEERLTQARDALSASSLHPDGTVFLRGLIDYLSERNR